MISRIHFDDETLQKFLHAPESETEQDVACHLETCEHCQSRLETITQHGLTMEEAAELLRVDPDQPYHIKDKIEFLEPSEHPGSMGRFGRYEVIEILGKGGMGLVLRGYDPALNRYSAIKILAPELATSAAARQRFSREAKSAAAVVHPHVVPIQTVDEHGGLPFLVMPVVEGQSLQERVESHGPLPVVEAIRIAAQIAEGLAAAHAQGLVHRDIKPANILLENGVERVQITDFGLARAVDDASMTRSGVIAGTPQYMSPEQAHGDDVDFRSDLFSLGSVIYFMLSGHSPFRAETTMGVLNRIANDQPRKIAALNSDVPTWLQTLLGQLLEKSPDRRQGSASEVALEFNRRLQELQSGQADPSSNPPWKLSSSSGGGAFRTIKAVTVFGGAFFGLYLLAVIVLPTKYGTLKIETNEHLEEPIQVVIRQNDQVVRRLTVDNTGAMTRIRAGSYTIELENKYTNLQLDGNTATVSAGKVWTTKVSFDPTTTQPEVASSDAFEPDGPADPTKIMMAAREQSLRPTTRSDAMKKIVWCWEHGHEVQPSWSAVRRSFLLSAWLDLAENYPPAMEKLREVREQLEQDVLSKEQIRVKTDDFADLASIDRMLGQSDRSAEVLKKLPLTDQSRVMYFLANCPSPKVPKAQNVQQQCAECHQFGAAKLPALRENYEQHLKKLQNSQAENK